MNNSGYQASKEVVLQFRARDVQTDVMALAQYPASKQSQTGESHTDHPEIPSV